MTSALIIEDGTKVADANSYITLEDANAYHELIGNDNWAGDDASLEEALIVAAQSLDALYGPKYMSYRLPEAQSLLWPRYAFYDNNLILRKQGEIPIELQRAQAEIALMFLNGDVNLFPDGSTTQVVKSESVKVGDIEQSITYKDTPDAATYDNYRKVDLLLYPLLKKSPGTVNLSR